MSNKVNQGIQGANITVNAGAVAVGSHAQAVSTAREGEAELRAAIRDLEEAVRQLALKPPAQEAVRQDISQLSAAAKDPAAGKDRWESLLKGVAAKLAAAGVVLKEGTSLTEGLAKIAGIVKVSMSVFGL